jgi:hypothetical protein
LHGTKFQGRPLVVDTDKGSVKAGYRSRGDWGAHTKYNDKVNRAIKKTRELKEATGKIKNYNPLRKVDRYEARDR